MGGRDIGTERGKGRDREGQRERLQGGKVRGNQEGEETHTNAGTWTHTHTHNTHPQHTHTHPSTHPPTHPDREADEASGDPDPEVSPPGAQSREWGWWRLGRVGNTS